MKPKKRASGIVIEDESGALCKYVRAIEDINWGDVCQIDRNNDAKSVAKSLKGLSSKHTIGVASRGPIKAGEYWWLVIGNGPAERLEIKYKIV